MSVLRHSALIVAALCVGLWTAPAVGEEEEVNDRDPEAENAELEDVPIVCFIFMSINFLVIKNVLLPRYRAARMHERIERGEKVYDDWEILKSQTSHMKDPILWRSMPSEYFHVPRVRTFKNFCAMPDHRILPPPPPCTLQTPYTSVRTTLYRQVTGTVITGVWQSVYCLGLFAVILSWWIRFAPIVYNRFPYSFFKPSTVFTNLGAAEQVHRIILPLASFSLALYVTQRLTWFYGVMNLVWSVQGKLHDVALLVGGAIPSHDDIEVREVAWLLYRYLSVTHIYTYACVCPRFQYVTEDLLVEQNLLLPSEAKEIGECSTSLDKKNIVILWISHIIVQLIAARNIHPYYAQSLMEAVTGLRDVSSHLAQEVLRVPPISFAQLLQLMVDGANMLTPPALAFAFKSDRDGLSVYMWPALGSVIIALFYQGGIKLINTLNEPFAGNKDDLNPDWALMASDRKLFGYLTGSNVCLGEANAQGLLPHEHSPEACVTGRRGSRASRHSMGSAPSMDCKSLPEEWGETSSSAAEYIPRSNGPLMDTYSEETSLDPEWGEERDDEIEVLNTVALGDVSDPTFDRLEDVVLRLTDQLRSQLRRDPQPKDPQEAWNHSQNVVMDLVSRFHEESRQVGELRAELSRALAQFESKRSTFEAPILPTISATEPLALEDSHSYPQLVPDASPGQLTSSGRMLSSSRNYSDPIVSSPPAHARRRGHTADGLRK